MPVHNSLFRELKRAVKTSLFFLFLMLNNISGISQSKLADNWEEELSKAKGQERVDLILKVSSDLVTENLALADSLTKEGYFLAKRMGDSLSMHRIGAVRGKVFYYQSEIKKGFEYAQRSLTFFEQNENLAFDKAKLQVIIAYLHMKKNAFTKADSLFLNSQFYFEKTENLVWKAKIANSRGFLYIQKLEYDKSLKFFSEGLKMSKQLGDNELTAKMLGNIALVKGVQGLYPEALEFEFQIISMECSDLVKANSYAKIAQTYIVLEDWEPAIKYLKKSNALRKKIGLKCDISSNLFSLGIIYKKQLNYGDAIKYLKQSLAIEKKCNLPIGSTLGSLGNVYNLLGQREKGNKYYDEQLKLAIANNDWEEIYYVNLNRGDIAYTDKEYDKALKYALKSYQSAVEKEHSRYLMLSNRLLVDIYAGLNNEEKSSFHKEEHLFYKDSILGLKKVKKIGALEQKHLMKLQKDSLDLINQENTSANYDQGFFSRFNIIIGICLLGLFLLCSFFFLRMNRKKEVAANEKEPLEQTKIDRYFEELFARLDQSKSGLVIEKNQPPDTDVTPINDMADFLKTNLSSQNDWASFEKYFEKIHKDFFRNLKSSYPEISVNELNMCALLRLNLLNKDISQIMGIGPNSVRKAQYRLSKKLELSSSENLREFVLNL